MTMPPNTPLPRDDDENDLPDNQQNQPDNPYESARAVRRSLEDTLGTSGANLLGQALGSGLRGAFGNQLGGMLDNTMRNVINEATGGPSALATGNSNLNTSNDQSGDDTYEMLWDCRFCGTTKLLGKTHRFCPNCGSPQDPSWRYYPSDDEKIAVKDHHYVGTDKTCPACGTLNAADAEFCPRCSAPQTEAAAVSRLQSRMEGVDGRLEQEDLYGRLDAQAAAAVSGQPVAVSKPSSGLNLKTIAIIAVIIAVVAGVGYFLTASRPTSVVLADKQWDREIEIERLQAFSDNAVCSSMPGDAYNVSRRREQIDTRRVQDGETCTRQQVDQGDGTFREQRVCSPNYREEPVYGDMCYYSIDRWETERTVSSNGASGMQPYWAEANIIRSGSCRGCEREGTRREVYVLVLTADGGKQYECEVDSDVWNEARIESIWTLDVGQFTNAAHCDSLELAR